MKAWHLAGLAVGLLLMVVIMLLVLRPRTTTDPTDDVVAHDTERPAPAARPRRMPPRRISAPEIPDDPDEDDKIVAADGGASRFAADDDGLDAAIEELEGKVMRCYQDVLDVEPGVAGVLEVSFVLIEGNGAGRLDHVQVLDERVGNKTLAVCIADRVSELSFDAPEADIEVTVPFEFVTDDSPRDPLSPDLSDEPEEAPVPVDGEVSAGG